MKITGITVGTTLPKSNFDQTDPSKGDYIKGDRSFLHPDSTLTQEGKSADAKAVGDAIKNSVADWNQNDDTALDYIKNRPFYTSDPIETVVLEEQTVTIDEDGGYQQLSGNIFFTEGETYIVNLNGVKYECVAWATNETAICVGSGNIYGGVGMGGDEPFSIDSYPNGSLYLNVATAGTYTLSISAMQPEIHYIDPKYIKDMYYTNTEKTTIIVKEYTTEGNHENDIRYLQNLKVGNLYRVYLNEDVYECVAWAHPQEPTVTCLGNGSIMDADGFGCEVPFCMWSVPGWSTGEIWFEPTEAYAVSVVDITPEIIKVPEKYLPEVDSVIDENSSNAVSSSAVAQAIKNSVHLEKSFFTIGDNPSARFEIQYFNEPKIYIAQDFSGNMHYYSEDALNWILISMPSETAGRIIYGKDKFIYRTSTHVYYSEDLITWNSSSLPTERNWYNIVYGNGIFLTAAKNDDEIYYSAYSTDGIAWTETEFIMPISFNIRLPQGLQYIDNKFILGQSNTNTIVYSFDGITWKRNNFNNNFAFHDTIYGGGDGKILVTGRLAEYIIWAENDELLHEYGWHHVKLPTNIGNCDQIIYANNTFFITDSNNGDITYSTDCENWITFNPANSSSIYDMRAFESICYDGEKFVASTARLYDGDSFISNCVMFSNDGFNWTYNKVELLSNGKNETADIKRALDIPQSDWVQNDEKAPDYVKNRPFYTDGLKETLVLEETVINIEDDGSCGLPGDMTLALGETYIVNFNGVTYECIAFTDYDRHIILGNGSLIPGEYYHTFPSADEPFLIFYDYMDNSSYIIPEITGSHTLSINLIQEKINYIDSKYIKNMYYDSFQYIPYSGNVNFVMQESWDVLLIIWPESILYQIETERMDLIVTFDDVVYECPSRYRPSGSRYFGNGYLIDNELDDTGEPFGLSQAEGGLTVISTSPGIHDISIVLKLAYRNFINDEYIPHNISRVGHTHPPSEIKNKYFILTDVETDSDYVVYIKNGNFASSLKCLGIEVKVPPIKTEYQRNELFDPTGMVVVAKYSGGNEEILNNKLFSSVTASYSGTIVLKYTDEIGITHTVTHDKTSFALVDFEYIDNGDGTYTLTDWKQTLNGEPSTELIIPDNPNIIL